MEIANWLFADWSELIQDIGIVAGFVFTALTVHREGKARKVTNLILLAERYHALWKQTYDNPELSRVLVENPGLEANPITFAEDRFVRSIVVHLYTVYQSKKSKMMVTVEGMAKDVKAILSLPIPYAIWQRVKPFQDRDFVEFVELALNSQRLI
jgi:hypothetical protein